MNDTATDFWLAVEAARRLSYAEVSDKVKVRIFKNLIEHIEAMMKHLDPEDDSPFPSMDD